MFGFSLEQINSTAFLVIAALNLWVAYLTLRTHRNVALIEKATNSMKDELVKSTALASYAEGHEVAQVAGEKKAAILAQGVVQGKADGA
jgi:hypothetical protein